MALSSLNNLYSGAAQIFNEAPHLAFQARLLAQERAKQDALDNYYQKLPLTINEKGVRDQDRPVIAEAFDNLKRQYIGTKHEIRKGNPAAIYNYEKCVREYKDLIGKSQSAGLTDMQVGKLKFNPNSAYMFQSPDTIEQLRKQHLPLNDPDHTDFDLETFTAPPKPYDRTTYFKNFASLKGNDNIEKTPNKDGITETLTNTPTYEEPQKEYVMQVAADKYLHDPSFKQMVDNDLGVPDNSNPLNNDFKRQFGHDIQTPIDLATAYSFNGLKPEPVTQKIQVDRNALMKKQQQIALNKMAANDALIRGRMKTAQGYKEALVDYRQTKTEDAQNNVLNKFIDNAYDAGTQRIEGTDVNHVTIDGKEYKGKVIDIPNSLKSEFAIYQGKDKTGTDVFDEPKGYYLTEDKKSIIPLYLGSKTAAGGYYIKHGKAVPIQNFKASLSKLLLSKTKAGAQVTGEDADDEFDTPKTTTTEKHTRTTTNKWEQYKAK